jgi:hypothetical protein
MFVGLIIQPCKCLVWSPLGFPLGFSPPWLNLISSEVIKLTTYLGRQLFVAPIIALRFLVDSRPFLLEVVGANNLGLLSFQAHLRLVYELFLT